MMHQLTLGVGVSKDRLDVFHPQRGACQIDNAAKAIRAFVRSAQREALEAADIPFSRLVL